jgi:hypothetical protein
MPPVRTVMVTLSPLLRDIIMQLVVSLELVAILETREAVADSLNLLAPELVIIGLLPGEDPAGLHADWPRADMLALAHDSRSAWLYAQDGHHEALADLSPESLLAAMRRIFRRRAGM